MAERFLIEPKSDGKPDPVIRLNIITGADVVGAAIESDEKVTVIKVSVRRSWTVLNAIPKRRIEKQKVRGERVERTLRIEISVISMVMEEKGWPICILIPCFSHRSILGLYKSGRILKCQGGPHYLR
jgi:hypothetical protein